MTVTTMPEASPEDQAEIVLGVDTHRDEHVAAVLSPIGALIATSAFATTDAGYRELLAWARSFGTLHRAGVECTGSYGAALSRHLQRAGVAVTDVNQTDRAQRRKRGKTDTLDAEAAARAVISGRATAIAKSGDGIVEAIWVMRLARNSAVNAKVKAINQLKAVIVGADPKLRDSLTGLGPNTLIRRCSELPDEEGQASDADRAVVFTLRLLATRIIELKAEAYTLHVQMRSLIERQAPELLEQSGVGPDSAAALLITAGDNPQRLHGEAGFAALCGTSPVEASSGMALPQRAGSHEVPLPCRSVPRPHRPRRRALDEPLETSPQRLRRHLRRTTLPNRSMTTANASYTVIRTRPAGDQIPVVVVEGSMAGIRARTWVPEALLVIVSVPPRVVAWSLIEASPMWPSRRVVWMSSISKPWPSSVTVTATTDPQCSSMTRRWRQPL